MGTFSFKSGENNVTVSVYMRDLQPGNEAENSLDVTVPMAAVKETSLSNIQAKALEVPVKMEEK